MIIKNKRILLTGGGGFIGSKLAEILSYDNELLIYDLFIRDSLKYKSINKKNVKLVKGDICSFEPLRKAAENFKPQIAVHLAAVAGVDTVIHNPVKTMEVNILGTFNFVRAIEKYSSKLERVLNFSTSEVFGRYTYKLDETHTTDLMPVGEARWTYSVSKLAAEHLVHSYNIKHKLKTVTIRPFNIYGEGQVGEGAIHTFVTRALTNEPLFIQGDGDQIRSWCYISDMIEGILLCMENPYAIGEIFNIGNPRGTTTINMLAYLIKMITKSSSIIQNVPRDHVDVEIRIPSISKAMKLIGYKPRIDIMEGLQRTVSWYREEMTRDV